MFICLLWAVVKLQKEIKTLLTGGVRISLIPVVSAELKPCSQIPKEN